MVDADPNCQQLPRGFLHPQKPLETHLRTPRRPLGNCWQFNLTLSAVIWSKSGYATFELPTIAKELPIPSETLGNPFTDAQKAPWQLLAIQFDSECLDLIKTLERTFRGDMRLLNCQQLPRSFLHPQKPLKNHLRTPRRTLGNCWQFNLTLSAVIWSKHLNERLEWICDFWIANNCQGASYTLRNPWKPIYGHPGSPLAIVGNSKYHWV